MQEKNIVSVKTSEHDVLLTARKNHPAVFVDGMFIDGIERVEFINHFENEDCEVLLTFNDRIENNLFPLDEVNLLEKLFGQTSNRKSLRDIVSEIFEEEAERKLNGKTKP